MTVDRQGNFYCCYMDYEQHDALIVIKSTDKGETWQGPYNIIYQANDFADKELIACDRTEGPYDGNLYVAWSQLWAGDDSSAVMFTRSTDGGMTFGDYFEVSPTRPIIIDGSRFYGCDLFAQPIVGSNGEVYVFYVGYDGPMETCDSAASMYMSKSTDGGRTWATILDGEFAHNFAIDGPEVYVVTDNGLFKSVDGETFYQFSQIYDEQSGERVYTTKYYSAGVDDENFLWVGSADGLAKTNDNGNTWTIFRAFVPTGQNNAPRTYAYPNPFSPLRHNQAGDDGYIRFQYNTKSPTNVTIRIYDFALDLVTTVVEGKERDSGDFAEVWNGRNDNGDMLANGVYFYSVELDGDGIYWGKIMILN